MAKTFGQMAAEAMAAVPAITPDEAHRRMREDPAVLLVDTLDLADRRRLGQPVGAVAISGGMIALRADREVDTEYRDERLQDRTRPIITICGGGPTSAIAAKLLQEMGFVDVSFVAGGTTAWREAGLPLEQPTDE